MMWDLPIAVTIDGEVHKIRNRCDYRVVLDAMIALNDSSMPQEMAAFCALEIFYEDFSKIKNIELAMQEMSKVISYGVQDTSKLNEGSSALKLMDWEYDFCHIAPAVSKVLGYSIRDPDKYTHWHDFVGAYMEMGECTFQAIIRIRNKLKKGEKLEDYEKKYMLENPAIIHLPNDASDEEWLNSDW